MDKSVLLVAFHFPPAAMGSSGHLRTLGFAKYLPPCGWKPVVLSARALAYPHTAPIADGVIPEGCAVHRAFALDVGRHFAIGGKYPGFLAQPDRWVPWWPGAVWQGLRIIRRERIKAIWSTYPIMTAHCIAWTLSRLAGIPWIADFRDPVATSVESSNPRLVASQIRWEQRVLRNATRAVFTTPGALRTYAERYPEARTEGRLAVIENGYDDAAFAGLPEPTSTAGRPVVLVHSGLLYGDGRNPLPFFTALARLKSAGQIGPADVRVVLRASGSEAAYTRAVDELGLGEMVTLAPSISNRSALEEQARADALLLFQGKRFDQQIPAKLYEYLRIGRPILALVSTRGDTAAVLRQSGGAEPIPMDDTEAIAARLPAFIDAVRQQRALLAPPERVARYARSRGAATLAALLDQVVAERSGNPLPGDARATPPHPQHPTTNTTR